jgi:alanine racemase
MQYSVKEIGEVIDARIVGNADFTFQNVFMDSRTIASPERSLFIAIRGERHDGHLFIYDLFQRGVRCFLVEKTVKIFEPEATYMIVDNTLRAFQKIAAYHRSKFDIPVIGITGSNGKTIVKEWIYQSLHHELNISRSPKSFNSQVGVPLSVLLIEPQHQIAILEAGISQPGEMEKIERVIQPTIGIFTNIGGPHQENFKSLKEKAAEKMKLFKNSKALIYCKDNAIINELATSEEYKHLELVSWSKSQQTFLEITSVIPLQSQTEIVCTCNGLAFSFIIPFIDEASIENALNLATLLLYLGYSADFITQSMLSLAPVAMRLELKNGVNQCTLINDSYNSDLGSLAIALDFLANQRQHAKKTVILSDILQSGQKSDSLYKEVSTLIKNKKVSRFIGIGPDIYKFNNLFGSNSEFYNSTAEFLQQLQPGSFSNEAILIKGSRAFEFEKIANNLEEKAHETVLEINLNAMIYNLNYFRSLLNPGTKLVAMVKAFSYGSGSHEIANLLQYHRVDYLAVAFADEGVALRDSGITMPIMVMNPEKHSFPQILKYKLEPEIYSFKVLEEFSNEAEAEGVIDFPVHLKLDTGMHRLGFMAHETEELIRKFKLQHTLKISSVFSHLAGSDGADLDYFTNEQIEVFETNSTKIINAFPYEITRHILNSAGIERFSQHQYDMVRLGIGLYGISSNNAALKQVSRLKTVILQIKEIPANETIGYGRKYKATETMPIAILPIGYADGIHRILGNGVGKFYINGKLVPIVGNICMDMCMVDLRGVNAKEGDEVIVFGDEYPITEIASQMKTIPYEVFTSISRRVKRIYYQE